MVLSQTGRRFQTSKLNLDVCMHSDRINPQELWESFRARPAMYLGEVSMENLRHFLIGYDLAARGRDKLISYDPFLLPRQFRDWVAYRLRVEISGAGWDYGIRQHAANEHEAFEIFLRLHEEFHARRPRVVGKVHNFLKASGDCSESSVIADRAWRESSPRPPKTLIFITYTSDPGFFVEAEDDPDFLALNFFSSFQIFERELGVTRDQVVTVDPH